ncbi:Lysine exporter LysO, partial [termite gut metagenome]
MKGSLIVVSFFALGMLCGFYKFIPYDFSEDNLSYFVLCVLMFCVGVSIGCDPAIWKSFRSLNPRLLFLPLMTILGTLIGCFVASFFLVRRTAIECMAVGSGFGYYSLSGILITEYRGVEVGIVALLSNIMREIITLLCTPLLVIYFGKLAPISAGGATTMDTTLPVIIRYSGKDFTIASIYHGFVV